MALAVLSACATSPTGRKQLMLLPESQMDAMGAQAFEQMKAETPSDSDATVNAYVKCIVDPIAQAAKGQTSVDKWEIVVFKDKSANAFALPGGKIGVHTGILPVAKTPAQLAAVLGHEVGHVIAKHGDERVSQGLVAQSGLAVVDAFLAGSATASNRNLIMGALGMGAQFGVLMPFGRTQESEADIVGLNLMADAGFDPRQSIELWKNMSAAGGNGPPEFLSTHPSHETRMHDLQAHMPEAMQRYEAAQARGKRPNCTPPR